MVSGVDFKFQEEILQYTPVGSELAMLLDLDCSPVLVGRQSRVGESCCGLVEPVLQNAEFKGI